MMVWRALLRPAPPAAIAPGPAAARDGRGTNEITEGPHRARWLARGRLFITTDAVEADPIGLEAGGRFAREIRRVALRAASVAIVHGDDGADRATGAAALLE